MTIPAYRLFPGTAPLLISMPHEGRYIPPAVEMRMTSEARRIPDTDWHLERLYDFARELGASLLIATHSRYVIDLNRPPDNTNLYPGQDTTTLCPTDTFDKAPLYLAGGAPDAGEIARRVDTLWRPYHEALAEELARLKSLHGRAALWDAHSIRSRVPRFFDGKLPDFNLGTASGESCSPALAKALKQIATSAPGYTGVLDGRFKGGYITRYYGRPGAGIEAIQLELSQATYMEEIFPFDYRPALAEGVKPVIRQMLERVLTHSNI